MKADALERAKLQPAQRALLQRFAGSPLAQTYYLTGGTALAGFYLHHRRSDDLDFFADEHAPLATIEAFIGSLPGLEKTSFQRLYDRRIFLLTIDGAPLKIEFTRYPFTRVTPLERLAEGIALDPPREILVNKLLAIVDRADAKDDVDVYFLLRQPGMPSLAEAAALAERKFGIAGLRYSLQSRLLAVPASIPPTVPTVDVETIRESFREEVSRLVDASKVEE